MKTSKINHLIAHFDYAFSGLGVSVPMRDIERLAMDVQRSMEYGLRAYHTSSHVLEMCQGMAPHQVLAALYHDVVYYQLDHGFPLAYQPLLQSVVSDANGQLRIRGIPEDDPLLRLCAGIFGFVEGDVLPLYVGMNEFLSAIVAVRCLSPWLKMADMARIVTCIEATVPFRAPMPGREDAMTQSATRLRETSVALGLGLETGDMADTLDAAVAVANRDVGGFAVDDPASFLSVTWLLIEESNAPLAAVGVYSIQDYRRALQRMAAFLAELNPDHIFHQHAGRPDAATIEKMTLRARENLQFAVSYLGAKLVTMAIIEAMALLTGGDAPVSMMLGDIGDPDDAPDRVDQFLGTPPARTDLDSDLLRVLEKGRSRTSKNDLTASPLTAYVYRWLGPLGMRRAEAVSEQLFASESYASAFLAALPAQPVVEIAEACARIALSRSADLLALAGSLKGE